MPVAETIPFSQLAQKLEEYRKDKVVPVLLDQSESNSVDTFLQYQHTTIIEGKKCVVDKMRGKPVDEIREELRKKLVEAMRHGVNLVLRLSNSAPMFKETFCDESTFPIEVFDGYKVTEEEVYKKLLHDDDHHDGRGSNVFFVRDTFSFVITSTFSAEDAEEFLANSFPLDNVKLVQVQM
eukprot:CAMPEP_0113881758 /NCGR_PEP_ID=MMETSP0780_2-20120614/8560_1 /TAXON_ID=652834 /ORGANISM="Palpitomonas bilix" /LENGTH=179 /DNA_ID=CAMNT_0000868663 /DNA_START=31 /DNA_END=570 /DNA_ORIENTATION=+ /assembly_acc=CAM_ASM_000599